MLKVFKSSLAGKAVCLLRPRVHFVHYVGGRGLEPPCLAALAPKASVSAISPPARFFSGCSLSVDMDSPAPLASSSLGSGWAPPHLFFLVKKYNSGVRIQTRAKQFARFGRTTRFAPCPPTWIRTRDLLLKREQLYQLSYGRKYSKSNNNITDFLNLSKTMVAKICHDSGRIFATRLVPLSLLTQKLGRVVS